MNDQALINQTMISLKEVGYKYTEKREAIISYLINHNRYLTAKEIYKYMSVQYPNLSYDTIYRNLRDFSELYILEVTELNGEMMFHYNYQRNSKKHYHHFICTICGEMREIPICPMDFVQDELLGCIIETHRFEILGRCEKCQ